MNFATKLLFSASLAFASLSASAALSPTYDSFGTLAGATFGGTGIPNNAVAIDTFTGKNLFGQNTGTITLGLTVTPRYGNPAVTNNGQGVFNATAGVDRTSAGSILDQLAMWNIGYYISGATSSNFYTYKLLLDVDPSSNENFKTLYLSANTQDSINIGSFVNELLGGYTFDPTRTGQYSLILEAVQFGTNNIVGMASVLVNVNAVPEPGSLALAGLALAGLATVGRRRRKA
ncbi:PEP-CTERM sorting domain-containing protein [Roseateles aquatilis]|nr:PEP-CTERM sorting domain-containing protein [Roseateles aquatilis]